MIPLLQPSCTGREMEAVIEVLQSHWWGMGPKCEEFESRMAKLYDYPHCVTVNSCTAALHLALLANDVKEGDEVIVPALTFISSALAATYLGAKVVFADVDTATLCIDWQDVQKKITARTKAIIPVDYAGFPADPTIIIPPDIAVIQDAAHSCGGYGYGDEICLSFHPVKPLATGDGGAILTKNADKADRMRALRWVGIDRSTWERSQKKYGWDYSIEEAGYKYHWNDIQAAIGLVQLDRLLEMHTRRSNIARRYGTELPPWVQYPKGHPGHTWHLYPVRVPAALRDALIDYLLEHGISAGVHYKPLTTYPMYQGTELPVTDLEWKRLISLPIFADMTNGEQDQVIEAVREFGNTNLSEVAREAI